jgi:hypothetical protein
VGGVAVTTRALIGGHTPDFAIYAGAASTPKDVQELQLRLKSIISGMEHSIATHEFERARLYSEEERTVRHLLGELSAQHNLRPTDDVEPIPFLCIEIIRDDQFSKMRNRFEDYLSAGVAQVWALDFSAKRAYSVTAASGLNEFKGDALRITEPVALELDLKRLFAQ